MLPQVIHFKYSSVYVGGLILDTEVDCMVSCMGVGRGETKAIRETSRGHIFHLGIMPGALWRFAYLIFATAQGVWYGCSCFPGKETEAPKVEDLVLGHPAGWQVELELRQVFPTDSWQWWVCAHLNRTPLWERLAWSSQSFKQRLGTNDFKVYHLPSKTQLPSPTASWMFPVTSHSKNCCSTCQLKQWSFSAKLRTCPPLPSLSCASRWYSILSTFSK